MVGLDPREKAVVLKGVGSQEKSSVVVLEDSAGVSKDYGAEVGDDHLSVMVSIWGRY